MIYEDKRYWKPPSYDFIAKKLGMSKSAVAYAIKGRPRRMRGGCRDQYISYPERIN